MTILLSIDSHTDEIRRYELTPGVHPRVTHTFVGYVDQPWPEPDSLKLLVCRLIANPFSIREQALNG